MVKQHGRENFTIQILGQDYPSLRALRLAESHFIAVYNTRWPNGYNKNSGTQKKSSDPSLASLLSRPASASKNGRGLTQQFAEPATLSKIEQELFAAGISGDAANKIISRWRRYG